MRFRAVLILMIPLACGVAGPARAARFSSLKKYDEVPMNVVSESFDDFEEPKLRPFWSAEGGAQARLVQERVTDGRQALEVKFSGKDSVLRYRRTGLDGFGGGYSRSLEVLGARFLFNDRFAFDAFNPSDKPVKLVVAFGSRAFPFTLRPGQNVVVISTEDIAAAVHRPTQATHNIAFSMEGGAPATVVFDALRLESESTGPGLAKHAKCFDFGPDDMTRAGFVAVDSKTGYDRQRGYGWLAPNVAEDKFKLQTVRSSGAEALDDLLRDGVTNLSSPFAVDLPNGKYRVHLVAGSNWTGIYGPGPTDYDFMVKAEGSVRYSRPRAAEQEERVRAAYGRDRVTYEFDEDLWAKFAADTYAPIEFDVEVADGRLDLEFQTSPQADRGTLNFMIVYPLDRATEVEPEVRRLWYGIMRRYNRVSFREIDRSVAAEMKAADVHEEFLNPKLRSERITALAQRSDLARGELALFARDHFEPVYPDTVPEPGRLTEVYEAEGAPGETVPVAVNVYALRDLRGLRVEADVLEGPRGRIIPAEAVDVRFVQYARRMPASRSVGEWQYLVVPRHLVKAEPIDVDRYMSVRFSLDVRLPADAPPGRYSGTALVSTAKGLQARARLDIDVHPFRLARAPEGRFAVVYYVQPFDPGNEPYGQAARSQATFGLPRSVARNVEQLYAKLHRQEIAASLDKLRRSGFDTLYGGDWLKDVEQANASLAEPMRFIDLNKANRAAQKRTSPETKRDPFVFVDAPGGAAYLYALESFDEKVVRSLRDEGLRVFLGYPNTTLPLVDDAGVARFTTGVYLWRLGADGVIAGPARASWGDPYNPFDGYGGERGSLLMPSSNGWPAPNSSRILEEMKEGIVDFRYLATLEKAIAAAGDIPEAKEAADYLARLRGDMGGRLADYVEPSGAAFRTRTDTGWTADRYIRLRRDVALHLLSLRRALGHAEGAEGAAQDWP